MRTPANPWKTLSRNPIYDNAWITVEEDEVINPSGKRSIYGKVKFKNKALAIIPWDHDAHIWLVGQWRYTLGQYSWEIPMGGSPPGEDLLEGARRELLEETGIEAQTWTPLLELHTSNCVTDEQGYAFLAEDLTLGSPQFDETEQLQICRIPFEEALDMAMTGKITDSISVASILKLARIRGY